MKLPSRKKLKMPQTLTEILIVGFFDIFKVDCLPMALLKCCYHNSSKSHNLKKNRSHEKNQYQRIACPIVLKLDDN